MIPKYSIVASSNAWEFRSFDQMRSILIQVKTNTNRLGDICGSFGEPPGISSEYE